MKSVINHSNRFKLFTFLSLLFVFLFGKTGIGLCGEEMVSIPHWKYTSLRSFLHRKKQELIVFKLGEEKLLPMTMAEILRMKV